MGAEADAGAVGRRHAAALAAARRAGHGGGLRAALAAAEAQGRAYAERGLNPRTFSAGVLNVAASGFTLGAFPQHFWLVQGAKALFLLSLVLAIKRRQGKHLHMLDFCWALTWGKVLAWAAQIWVVACPSLAPGWLAAALNSRRVFRALFVLATGPLGVATFLLNNAMLLHDTENMASLFIHISPPFTVWCARWFAGAHREAYPGAFLGLPTSEADAASVGAWEYVAPALATYWVWWVVYTIWLLARGRFHSEQSTGCTTVYHLTACDEPAKKLCEYDPRHPTALAPAVRYMAIHGLGCSLTMLMTRLFWCNFMAHTIFCAALLFVATWNGALRYTYMMTKKYSSVLESEIRAYEAEIDGGGSGEAEPAAAAAQKKGN